MFRTLALLTAVVFSFHWVKVAHSSYAVEQRYVNVYGNVLGSYYLPRPQVTLIPIPNPYVAQCYEGPSTEFTNEADAKAFVLRCPKF